jgi:predicted AlkP superfamily pyrophosphatase or phosphodiesterase
MTFLKPSAIILFAVFFVKSYAQDTLQHVVPNRSNSQIQQSKPYVILISADGFRYDLAKKFNAKNLLRLQKQGVTSAYMRPSYPSLTFPNHYTIVTGLYPAHHGLVDNGYFDPARKTNYSMGNKKQVADSSWYGGTPIWVLAEQQQLLSASFYWVASEAAIQGIRPSYYYTYNDKIGIDSRVQTVKNWLSLPAESRPHLICFYFPEVDHAEHLYGPDSKEAADAVQFVDESVGKLVAAVDTLNLPVNFIFVSDHGMTNVDNKETLPLPACADTSKFIIPNGDALLHLYAKNPADIKPTYTALKKEAKDFNVYLAKHLPKHWHYSKKDDGYNRIGDIILVPILPKVFSITRKPTSLGKHGFDPYINEMHASFYAWGPAFKSNYTIKAFDNVHVYPLIAEILGLPYTFKIDGKLRVLHSILKN